jgi:hypothetical protein
VLPDTKVIVPPTNDECLAAQALVTRFQLASSKLDAELQKVKARKVTDRDYYKEWEDLRAEAAYGLFSDILDAAAAAKILKHMASNPDYEKIAPQLEAAFDSLRFAARLNEGISAQTDHDRVKNVLDATMRARDALLRVPVAQLPKEDEELLNNFTHFYEAFIKVLEFYLDHRDRNIAWSELATSSVKLAFDVTGLWVPPVKLGVKLEGLGERGVKYYLAQLAMTNLDGVLAKDWLAELYLRQRLEAIKSFSDEEKRTLKLCAQR